MMCKKTQIVLATVVVLFVGSTASFAYPWAYPGGETQGLTGCSSVDNSIDNKTPTQIYSYYDDTWDYYNVSDDTTYNNLYCWFNVNGGGVFDSDGNYYVAGDMGLYPSGVLICIDSNMTEKYKVVFGWDDDFGAINAAPALDDPTNPSYAYILDEDGHVVCIDLAAREEMWRTEIPWGGWDFHFSPSVDPINGDIRVLDENGRIYWLDPSDGSILKDQDYITSVAPATYVMLAGDSSGNMYFGDDEWCAYKVDQDDTLLWTFNLSIIDPYDSVFTYSSLIVSADASMVYITTECANASVIALDGSDGSVEWNATIPDAYNGYSPMGLNEPDDVLYVHDDYNDTVNAFNASTGDLLWRTYDYPSWSGALTDRLPIDGDGCIYLFESDNTGAYHDLVSIYPNGTQKWNYTVDTGTYGDFGYTLPSISPSGKLWIANDWGYIFVWGEDIPIVSEFTADTVWGYSPLTVQFTDLSTGAPISWNWSFGDGTYSNDQNPTHVYETAGTYDVTLTVDNGVP